MRTKKVGAGFGGNGNGKGGGAKGVEHGTNPMAKVLGKGAGAVGKGREVHTPDMTSWLVRLKCMLIRDLMTCDYCDWLITCDKTSLLV